MSARHRVVITGVGAVTAVVSGGADAVAHAIAAAIPADGERVDRALAQLVDAAEARRLSRVSQLTLAAGRLALDDAGLPVQGGGLGVRRAEGAPVCCGAHMFNDGLGIVLGTELGDLRSTIGFADGFLSRGPAGLSPLLFPNTVMNTMAAATAIALSARDLSLTLNAPTVAGEMAVIRAAAAVAAGRAPALLAGGVDEVDPAVAAVLEEAGGWFAVRGEGSAFVVLESLESARARSARILGEILSTASAALPASPHGVGRRATPYVVLRALANASVEAAALGAIYAGHNGDARRDAWETRILEAAAPGVPAAPSLARQFGQTSALGPLKVLAAAGAPPTLVHGLARGGSEVAIVIGAPPRENN
jgi:3-oxoacyl-[acyl-carrier-protein] synthase II